MKVKITESQLRQIVTESVKKVLKEGNYYDYASRKYIDKPEKAEKTEKSKSAPHKNSYGGKSTYNANNLLNKKKRILTTLTGMI